MRGKFSHLIGQLERLHDTDRTSGREQGFSDCGDWWVIIAWEERVRGVVPPTEKSIWNRAALKSIRQVRVGNEKKDMGSMQKNRISLDGHPG